MNENMQQPPPLPSSPQQVPAAANVRSCGPNEKYCESCGQIIKKITPSCPYCGQRFKKNGLGCIPIAAILLGVGFFMMIILGILAAIAIPNFIAYRDKAYVAVVKTELTNVANAQEEYYVRYGQYATRLDALQLEPNPQVQVRILNASADCYEAQGVHQNREEKIIEMDCNGFKDNID